MAVIQEMRDVAASLEPGSQVRKMLTWAELELGERAEQIFELEEEIKQESDARIKVEQALHNIKQQLEQLTSNIREGLFAPSPPPRDTSGFARISQTGKAKKAKAS